MKGINMERPLYRPMMLTVEDLGAMATAADRRDGVTPQSAHAALAATSPYSRTVVIGSDEPALVTGRRQSLLSGTRCAHCDTVFTPRRATARFCSDRCRNGYRDSSR
jgi:hypothetical protein